MKLKQIASGIATGYATRALQFLVTLALVPFLLRSEILGVEGYGRAFALIALMGLGTVVTAGVRISFERSIAQAIGASEGDGTGEGGARVGSLISTGSILLIALCGGLALLAVTAGEGLLEAIGLPVEPVYLHALTLSMLWMIVENAFFLLRSPLMARGAITFVNAVAMAEVVLRSLALFVVLGRSDTPFVAYFALHLAFAAARYACFVFWDFRYSRDDLVGLLHPTRIGLREAVAYSGSVTSSEAATFLVRRAPVILASRYLGAVDAGLTALVINTIQNYVLQILFSVVRPIALPLAARFDPRALSATARRFFFDLEGIYCTLAFVVVAELIALAPPLVELWLGGGYQAIVLPAQVVLAGAAFEISYGVRRSLIVGQGLLNEALRRILLIAAVALVLLWVSFALFARWEFAAYATGAYLALSNVLPLQRVWSRHFDTPAERSPGALRFLSFLPIFLAALLGSRILSSAGFGWSVGVALGVLCVTVGVVHVFVLPLPTMLPTFRRLSQSMNRNILQS